MGEEITKSEHYCRDRFVDDKKQTVEIVLQIKSRRYSSFAIPEFHDHRVSFLIDSKSWTRLPVFIELITSHLRLPRRFFSCPLLTFPNPLLWLHLSPSKLSLVAT